MEELDSKISRNPSDPRLYLTAGEILDRAGFYQKAHHYLLHAQSLDPTGAVLAEFRRRRYDYYRHDDGCSACDALCGLCVLDTCCECMGGDLIGCC